MLRHRALGTTILAAACLGAAGCGGDDGGNGAAIPPTTPVRGSVTFDVESVEDGATVGGQARLEPVGTSRTRVVVDGIDESEPGGGGANPVRLVPGTCDTPAEGSGFELTALKGSTSTTTIDVPLAKLLAQPYHVEVFLPARAGEKRSDDAQGALIACGDVPSG